MRIKTRLEFRTVEVWKSLATSRRTVERRGGGARLTDVGSGRGEERKGSRWLEITAEGGAAERGKLTKASWRERRSVVVQTGSVPLVLRRWNKYQFIRVLMGRTQGSGQSWMQEERGGWPQSRLGATGVVRGQRPGGGWASPKAQTRVVVTGGKTKHAVAGGGSGRRWRVTVISRSPPIASLDQ